MELTRRDSAKPAKRAATSASDVETSAWEEIERSEEFRRLVAARVRFVAPATVFFLVYYFLLPIGNGLAPGLMRTNVVGHVNIAYLFALSQFVMAWTLAWFYIRRANRVFDPLAEAVRRRFNREEVER